MRRRRRNKGRSLALVGAAVFLVFALLLSAAGNWFVHHPRKWIEERERSWPRPAAAVLEWFGNPSGDLTDAFGLTGEDVTVLSPVPAPTNTVLFAGIPVRTGAPAPRDIVVLDRGEFIVGWSPKLRHAAWCAYHVPREQRYQPAARPPFRRDKHASRSPNGSEYARSGYDRGHMAPNFAIASRFGQKEQSRTFLMSNISPQTPALNRGVWRDIEHRIANGWPTRYGEIWVIVGALDETNETLPGTDISVPSRFWQVVVAQSGREVRALGVVIEQNVPWKAWPTRYIVSIDELEALTGFDFLSKLPDEIEESLESRTPTRLWPVGFIDALRQLANRSAY